MTGVPQSIERNGRKLVLLPLFHPAAALWARELMPVLKEGFAKLPRLLAGLERRR